MALIALVIGLVAIWSNPNRLINRVFFSFSVHVAAWLWFLHTAISSPPGSPQGFFWLHVTNAAGAAIPFHLWLVKEAVAGEQPFRNILVRSLPWLAPTLSLMAVVFTPWFIPKNSSPEHRLYGLGYYYYIVGILVIAVLLLRETVQQMRRHVGVRRAELQILLMGGTAALATTVGIMAAKALLGGAAWLGQLRPIGVIVFYACTVIAITTHRLFDARQLLLLGLQKFLLVGIVAAEMGILYLGAEYLMPAYPAIFFATGISLWTASQLSTWLNRRLQFYPEASAARAEAFKVTQAGLPAERVAEAAATILKGWGKSDLALVWFGPPGALRSTGLPDAEETAAIETLRSLAWATPERLNRLKPSQKLAQLTRFLAAQQLGVAVLVEGPTLQVLAGVGVSASRRPYTYPQVTLLMELVTIFEGAFERASLSAKAQHAEQLATVGLLGASLAHEIRNPLVTIKTFVQLLPTRHQDPVFREKFFRLMSAEVDRIDRLTEQLLDLASPHSYIGQMVALHPILKTSLELVAPKAADKHVKFEFDLQAEPDQAFTDPSAIKQVLLNLCFNAIQAMEKQETERWVRISTRRTASALELAVADNGPGIPQEMHARLFQPFQSTKSTGFGLGLAICRDILTGLGGDIHVDPPVSGQGATFRVTFPCQPLLF
jgi:signal transduction histidine kinase